MILFKDSTSIDREQTEELVNKAKQWLKESENGGQQDLITREEFMHGFEWPHIIWIGRSSSAYRTSNNIMMRTVSTFSKVLLRDSFLDQKRRFYFY